MPTVSTLLSCAGCLSQSYQPVFDMGLNAHAAAAWRVALSRVSFFFFSSCFSSFSCAVNN